MLLKLRQSLSEFDIQLWILFGGWIISAMGFSMVVPFVSIYFHMELGVPMSVVGTFFLVTAIIRACSQIIAGNLSDNIGRKNIMIFAQIFRGVVFFGVALSIHLQLGFWITALILISGYLLASFFQPVANAMVADIVPVEQRTEAYGLLKIAANIGWGIGPAIGGFLAKVSYAALFFVGGVFAILSGVTIILFIQESRAKTSRVNRSTRLSGNLTQVFQDKLFLKFCIASLMMFLTMAQLIATLSVYAKETIGLSHSELGLIYSTNAFIVVIFQLLISRLIRHRNLLLTMTLGSLLYGIGYGLMALPNALPGILLLIGLITFAEMMVGPASSSMVGRLAPNQKNGLYMGAFGLFGTLGWSIGPFIGGILLEYVANPFLLWFGVATFGFVGAMFFLLIHYQHPEIRY